MPEQTGLEFLRPIFLLGPLVTSDISTAWIQEEVQSRLVLRPIFLFWVPLVTSDVYSMDTGRGPEQTGLEFMRPICFDWSLMSRVMSTAWIQEEVQRMPKQTGLEFMRPIFLFWVLLSRVMSTAWIQEEVQRMPEQTSLEFMRSVFLFWVLLSRVISLQHGCRKRSRADWS